MPFRTDPFSVCDYVHLNPARAALIAPTQKLEVFRWSSYPAYLESPRRRAAWLRVERLLGEHGIPKDSAAGRRRFAEAMESRRAGEGGEEFQAVRRGWYLGDKAFGKELLAQMTEGRGVNHYGPERFEEDEAKACRVLAMELKARGWREGELKARRKSDKGKVAIAARLREETTMTLKWIAERLVMGSWTNVSNLLGARRRNKR